MSRIDQLICALCPDGVEYVSLWEVTAWDKKFNGINRTWQRETRRYTYLLAQDLRDLSVDSGGTVRLLGTGSDDFGWTTPEIAGDRLGSGEIVAIPWGGNPSVQYFNGDFVTADNRIAVSRDPARLAAKFLYYLLLSRLRELSSFYRGAGIQHPSMAKVLAMRIPLPPLKVQLEIVKILDTFTELQAELDAELEARRRQYEHYRHSLLSFAADEVRWVPMGDVLEQVIDHRGKTPKKLGGDWAAEGHRVISALNIKNGIVDENDHHYIDNITYNKWMRVPLAPGDVLLTSEAPLGSLAFIDRDVDWAIGQRVYALRPKASELDGRFLLHLLAGGPPRMDLFKRSSGSTVSGIRQSELVQVAVPLPPMDEQRRIARILDRFDALVNDISLGLPAEIAARRKQYEFYRDRLLSFEERVA